MADGHCMAIDFASVHHPFTCTQSNMEDRPRFLTSHNLKSWAVHRIWFTVIGEPVHPLRCTSQHCSLTMNVLNHCSVPKMNALSGLPPSLAELEHSISNSENKQRKCIAEAVKKNGHDPKKWTKDQLGLVSVKAKHIGAEWMMDSVHLGASFESTPQDMSHRLVAKKIGDKSVDDWPKKEQVMIATVAKEWWEGKGITF